MDEEFETRTRRRPSGPAKLTTIIGVALLVLAVYYLLAPVLYPGQGGNVACGSALSPETRTFNKAVCNGATQPNLMRAIALAVIAVVVAGLGLLFYGVESETLRRPVSRAEDDTDEDDDFDDPPRRPVRTEPAGRSERPDRPGRPGRPRRSYDD
ncbi:hypothetical protein G9U51_00060 [Calidifontibacter sp. DB0510]|uniref:Uncharacterized protein n=1 Tax=Metallococcus carri TaxID=1656884 RepID=A0A967B406_9MICO|nr:hypothetical protein [Metallococcus carri]NHN54176.1 hypothetical protein [Metallococcus carri]NOP36984.1 hypothetical protein [Calidifontibacter sp. DB2511S]